LRIFDEFYQVPGFSIDYDYRFARTAHSIVRFSPGNLLLHLSEHHADGISASRHLILLRHKAFRGCLAIGAAQHGHRGNLTTMAAISRRRIVAIEFGMCRSARSGGASGLVMVG
jgi:hypothetical protein